MSATKLRIQSESDGNIMKKLPDSTKKCLKSPATLSKSPYCGGTAKKLKFFGLSNTNEKEKDTKNDDKLHRMVNINCKTDIMPEPFDVIKKFASFPSVSEVILLCGSKSVSMDSTISMNDKDKSRDIIPTKLNSKDYQTLLCQLILFRKQMITKIEENKSVQESDLLKSWRLVYDAEEKEFDLQLNQRMAADVLQLHQQLLKMNDTLDAVVKEMRPSVGLLQSFIGLSETLKLSIQNAKTVKRINCTLLCNNEYASHLLELDRVVRTLELLEEKQHMSIAAPVATTVKTHIYRHSIGGSGSPSGERKSCDDIADIIAPRTP